jgi:WD40 repeat protein
VRCAAFSPDGKRLLLVGSNLPDRQGELRLYDWSSARTTQPALQTGETVSASQTHLTSVCFGPGDLVYVAGRGSDWCVVRQYRCGANSLTPTDIERSDADGRAQRDESWPRVSPRAVIVGTDGKVALLSRSGQNVQVFDGYLGGAPPLYARRLFVTDRFTPRFLDLAGHAGSGQFALACNDGAVRVYEAKSLDKPLQVLRGHSDPVFVLAFSPDGKRLATCGGEGTVKVWDPATGQELLSLPVRARFNKSPVALAFSGDGRWLAVAATAPGPGGDVVYLFGG